MKDPDFVERFKQACNEPKRIKKISNSSKQLWKDAKTNDVEKYRRMLMSQKNKNYELNGYVMNAIEYQIGNLLNDMNLVWEYERIFNINENSYLPDFYLPDYDIIIECYGDFWHANPKYMTPTDTTHKYITAIDIWNRDKQRVDNLRLCVKNVVCLWEDDIINDINNCKQLIKENI
jgi:G:T-mismatch repair DNA endonuclease (very short patch repair protein)